MAADPSARPRFISVRQPGLGGLVTKPDPQDLKDIESPDLRNIVFHDGYADVRGGSTLYLDKPAAESGKPLQLMKAHDSRGNTYLIAVYGKNFYLLDTVNKQWILLNNSITPTQSTLPYGYDNWNQGSGSDFFYFCNGVDDMYKWWQALSTIKTAYTSGGTSLVLNDTLGFPASGNLIVMDNSGTPTTVAFSANDTSTGTLTITDAGKNLNVGNSVTMAMADKSGMKIGSIVRVSAPSAGVRLFVANKQKLETTIYFSKSTDQEDFGTTADSSSGGSIAVTTGSSGILDLVDYGTFLMIVQKDAFSQFIFTINTTTNTIIWTISPLIYGESITPIGQFSAISVENTYIYATKTQGIYQLVPSMTGYISQNQNRPFSDAIITLLNNGTVDFSNARTEFWRRMMFFLISTIPGVNDLTLIYDFNWGAWTLWDNLNAVDIKEKDDTLYYLCNDDGALYYHDETSKQDYRADTPIGYSTRLFTKRFDFGEPANPKQNSFLMVQGVITQNTKLYVDVLYNEAGSLAVTTYVIDGSAAYVNQVPVFGIGRASLGENPLGGYQAGTIGVFRVYLDLLHRLGAHHVQVKFYSENTGDDWGVNGIAFNPEMNEVIPKEYVVGI